MASHPHPGFRRIGLIAKPEDPRLVSTLERVDGFLAAQGVQVVPGPNAAAALGRAREGVALADMGSRCDLALVIGGDGTLLTAARELAPSALPLAGINLGRLGFLVDISPEGMIEALSAILQGDYREDRRFLLEARIGDAPPVLALNDVVLHKWNLARMVEFETWIDGVFVDVQRSDGVILSTPTGSTAYALSGGGPLLMPNLDAMAIVPICPHTLSNRPLVIPGDSRIELRVCGRTDPADVRVTCDGQHLLSLSTGHHLSVHRHPQPVRLIHPADHDHFELLRAKLGWGEKRP